MENRKVRLSKQLLKQAFLELLEEKNIHQISIRQLCEKADLNRSTFYAHYEDINFLIRDIEEDILCDIPFMDCTQERSQKDIIEFAKFIEKNYQTVMALVRNGKLVDRIVEISVQHVLKEGSKTPKDIEIFTILSHFCLGGMFQSLLYYSNHKRLLTVQEISQIIYQIFIEAENIRFNIEKKI